MKIYIAKNTGNWLDRHERLGGIAQTDWWHNPSAKPFRKAAAGDLFFVTRAGTRDIFGFATLKFDYREESPGSAWQYSSEACTADSTYAMRAAEVLQVSEEQLSSDSVIGLIVLLDLHCFPPERRPRLPKSFNKFTVTGRVYDASEPDYEYLKRLADVAIAGTETELVRDRFIRCTDAQIAEIVPLHRELAVRFKKWLICKEYGQVLMEQDWMDFQFSADGRRLMAELKICYGLNTRQAIREALGQILEYNHFDRRMPHDEWWIILDQAPTPTDKAYVERIRNLYDLPFYLGYESISGDGEFVIDR